MNIHCPQNVQTLDFQKMIAPPIDSDFFSAQTEIKTSGALSEGRCGCRKELKLKKGLSSVFGLIPSENQNPFV